MDERDHMVRSVVSGGFVVSPWDTPRGGVPNGSDFVLQVGPGVLVSPSSAPRAAQSCRALTPGGIVSIDGMVVTLSLDAIPRAAGGDAPVRRGLAASSLRKMPCRAPVTARSYVELHDDLTRRRRIQEVGCCSSGGRTEGEKTRGGDLPR